MAVPGFPLPSTFCVLYSRGAPAAGQVGHADADEGEAACRRTGDEGIGDTERPLQKLIHTDANNAADEGKDHRSDCSPVPVHVSFPLATRPWPRVETPR